MNANRGNADLSPSTPEVAPRPEEALKVAEIADPATSRGIAADGRWSCSGCDTRWHGLRLEHCSAPGCHRTFASTTAGDLHRRDHQCVDPAEIRHGKTGEPLLEQRADGAWTTVTTPARRASLDRLIARHKAKQ